MNEQKQQQINNIPAIPSQNLEEAINDIKSIYFYYYLLFHY
jgi:hypothetical protein